MTGTAAIVNGVSFYWNNNELKIKFQQQFHANHILWDQHWTLVYQYFLLSFYYYNVFLCVNGW